MPSNADVTRVLQQIADLLSIDGANPFRVRAYREAARVLEGLPQELPQWLRSGGQLADLPGIGEDLAGKIQEILRKGDCALFRELRRSHPKGLLELLRVPGLGPKTVRRLHEELGVASPAQLRAAARAGRVRRLRGFGASSESRMLAAVESFLASAQRLRQDLAWKQAQACLRYLRAAGCFDRVLLAGSMRRLRETVGDLDLVATAAHARAAIRHFLEYDEVERVLARGTTRASVLLRGGLQVDLRVVDPASFGAALLYFTGSKAHSIALRRIAKERGLKLNEYGVWRGQRRLAGETEASMYAALGLPYIEPELREDRGELEAARQRRLPRLVDAGDLHGDLHCHTEASDGSGTLAQMAAAARAAGLEYLAITDHSRSLRIAHGLDAARLEAQIEAIDRFNASARGLRLLKGIEVEILEDGRLDLAASLLAKLDLVIGAIHSSFGLSRSRQTARVLRAMDSPCFSILAHPTGRLLGEREPCELDLDRIIRQAAGRGCFLELNAQPQRLDLPDSYCRVARDAGVLIAISSDAHHPSDVGALEPGVGQARRAWLERSHVLNARPLSELLPLLSATMVRASR